MCLQAPGFQLLLFSGAWQVSRLCQSCPLQPLGAWLASPERLFHAGVPSQPVLKLPAFAAAVTAVAFAPASRSSSSLPHSSGTDLLAVGLENGGLQLWGLQRQAKTSSTSYIGVSLPMPGHPPLETQHAACLLCLYDSFACPVVLLVWSDTSPDQSRQVCT